MYTSETSTVMFHQENRTVEDQAQFYNDELGQLGWTKLDSSEIADGVAFLDFQNGSLSITVTINPSGDHITTIAQGSGVSVPESQDDQ